MFFHHEERNTADEEHDNGEGAFRCHSLTTEIRFHQLTRKATTVAASVFFGPANDGRISIHRISSRF